LPDVVGVASPFSPGNGFQIASDRFIAYLTVTFTTASYRLPNAAGEAVIHTAQAVARPGLVVARSRPSWGRTPGWPRASRWALTMVIMLVAFGSVVAMGLPIVIALVGLAVGVAIEELTTHFLVVPVFSPELAVMMGVGVGIDDALLIVPRYRQHLGEGATPSRQRCWRSNRPAGPCRSLAPRW
jgi:RND superfamily putative drug exporter